MVLSAICSWAQTSPYTGVAPGDIVSGNDYYLYNVESGLWLQNNDRKANDWSTRGQLGVRGLDFQLNASGGGYKINAKFGRQSINRDDFYLDNNDDHIWQFVAVEKNGVSNAVNIKSDARYLTADPYTAGKGYNNQYNAGTPGQNQWYLNNPDNNNNGTWQIVTKEERLAKMVADGETAAQDATWLVASPDFANNDRHYDKWVKTGTWVRGGDANGDWGRGSMIIESWNSGSAPHMYQTVSVPNGMYSVTVQGFYRDGSTDGVGAKHNNGTEEIRAKYYANDVEKNLRSVIDGHDAAVLDPDRWRVNTDGWYVPDNMADCSRCMNIDFGYQNEAIEVNVTNGQLKIGVYKTGGVDRDWVIFDNWKVTYLGPVDVTEILAGLKSEIEKAQAIDQTKLTEAAKTALNDAIANAQEYTESKDADAITEACQALTAIIQDVENMDITPLQAAIDYVEGRGYTDDAANDVLKNGMTAKAVNDAVNNVKVHFKQHVADKSVQPTVFTKVTNAVLGEQNNERTFEVTDLAKGLYIYNVGTGRWFCGGDDWGAHAAVGFPGIKVTLPADNYGSGQYNSIITHLYNGNWGEGGKLNHEGYCDTGGNGWKFYNVDAAKGIVTIARNGNDQGDQASNDFGRKNLVGFADNTMMRVNTNLTGADNPNNQWIFVTEAQRDEMAKAAMATASATNPVDLTYKIGMPGFNQRERVEGSNQDGETLAWTCNHANYRYNAEDNGSRHAICERGANHADFCIDIYGGQWEDAFSWTQTIENLAPGKYRVKVQGYNNGGDAANKAKLVAGSKEVVLRERDSESELPWQKYADSTWEAIEYFQNGLYWNEVECVVGKDGKLKIGVESPMITGGHVVLFDNFRLECLGLLDEVTVGEAKYTTYIPAIDVNMASNADVTAYVITSIEDNSLKLTEVETVPAGEIVIVKATAPGTYELAGTSASPIAVNELHKSNGFTVDLAYHYYVLAKPANEAVGFYPVKIGTKIAKGKGFIEPVEEEFAKFYPLEGETNAIESVIVEKLDGNVEVYNLAGQKLQSTQKGVNIINGKKVVIK